jgi:hypothetical protein
MEKKLEYSFDDEPVSKFCYELECKKIELNFKGYFDLLEDKYKETPCIWTIENWNEAKCKIGDDAKLYEIEKSIGIFTLILYMKYYEDERLEMLINTLDNRYITLFFKKPNLSLNHK